MILLMIITFFFLYLKRRMFQVTQVGSECSPVLDIKYHTPGIE